MLREEVFGNIAATPLPWRTFVLIYINRPHLFILCMFDFSVMTHLHPLVIYISDILLLCCSRRGATCLTALAIVNRTVQRFKCFPVLRLSLPHMCFYYFGRQVHFNKKSDMPTFGSRFVLDAVGKHIITAIQWAQT